MARSLWLSVVLLGCDGLLAGGVPSPETPADTPRPRRPGTQPSPNPGAPTEEEEEPFIPPEGPAWPVSTRGVPSALRRLTRDELVTTFQALTGEAPPRADLPAEPHPHHQPPITTGKPLIANELSTYAFVVSSFAERVAPAMLTRSACRQTGAAQRTCLSQWATGFAVKAFRRELRTEETSALTMLLTGADGTATQDTPVVAAVLNAIFFSPSFVYRSDLGVPTRTPNVRGLSPREIATRLSYLSTLGPPDEALLMAAAAGQLNDPAVRQSHFDRLRRTPAGGRALAVMVLEWLGANEQKVGSKSAQYRQGLPTGFEADLRSSADTAIIRVLESSRPTLAHLFSTETYLTDAPVKAVSQVVGMTTGDGAETRRGGLLMHPHVLAAATKENGVSPFQLGTLLKEAVLCEKLPPPPVGAAMQARADVPAGASLRESFEHRTNVSAECTACHAQFAPLGYAFLPFDPVGRWFTRDASGKAWNLSGAPPTYSGILAFQSPRELSEKLGESPQAQGCFAQFAATWVFGRGLLPAETALVDELDATVKRSGGDVLEIVRAIIRSPAFITTTTGT